MLSDVEWFRDAIPDLSIIDAEMASLHRLVEALENGTVVTQDGVDVTAGQLAQLKQMLAYLDAVLFRFNHSRN